MDIETLKTCGLIINELITNSIKYAFPEKKGNIEIILKKENRDYILEVNDNGTGFPENFNATKIKSSGLFLVKTLSQGINGNLEFKNDQGAHTKLIFPVINKRKAKSFNYNK